MCNTSLFPVTHLPQRQRGGVSSAAAQLWKMASGKDKEGPELEDVPATLFLSVWEDFGFCATCDEGSKKVVDKTAFVCKHCGTRVTYASGNTSHMLAHPLGHHSGASVDRARRRDSGGNKQLLLPQHLNSHSVNSQTGQSHNESIWGVHGERYVTLCHDTGFQQLIKVLKLHFSIPSHDTSATWYFRTL